MNPSQKNLDNFAIEILNKEDIKRPNLTRTNFPCTFPDISIDTSDFEGLKNKWYLKAKPEYSKDLIGQYQFFNQWIQSPKNVFYPCSNIDASPIKGFPGSEVTMIDKDEEASYVMKNNKVPGFIEGDVLNYSPTKPFDLVIILNPAQKSSDLTKHLVKGGFVLANNWHNSASQLLEDPNYQGIGTIDKDENGFLLKRNFDKLEPNQFATYLYVFRNGGLEAA